MVTGNGKKLKPSEQKRNKRWRVVSLGKRDSERVERWCQEDGKRDASASGVEAETKWVGGMKGRGGEASEMSRGGDGEGGECRRDGDRQWTSIE